MASKNNTLILTPPRPTGISFSIASSVSKSGTQNANGGSGTNADDGGEAVPAGPQADPAEQVSKLTQNLYASTFKPQEVTFETESEETLRNRIAQWLRPNYDQAILNRQKQTKTYGAELDADAIARGMGASTYVTDVKSRQMNEEAEDIALLETDYGAVLAQNLTEQLANQQELALDNAQFNSQQQQDAYELAYQAALTLYNRYGSAIQTGDATRYAAEESENNSDDDTNELTQRQAGTTAAQDATYRRKILA